jgi:hypothetical protein
MTKCFLFLILLFCSKLFSQNISGSLLSDKYLIFADTGFVIYTQPHFKGLFISTSDTSLVETLKKNSYLPYFFTYNDDFKDFILKNDTIPVFIKKNNNVDIYSGGRLEQRSISYFRAVVTVRVSMMYFKYMAPDNSLKKDFFLRDVKANKDIYLREYFRSYLNVLECVSYKLL